MMFDFDRFITAARLAYRRCNCSSYSLNEVLQVFRYYFETYELVFEEAHPMISINQIASIIDKMPFVLDEGEEASQMIDITPEDYKVIIDQHFITNYLRCDYNINHFFSGRIREMRFFETLY